MGIITHPDQIVKTRENERGKAMFPRGPHQMVAYCYAVEGVAAHERSIHARMIDMAQCGDIEPFDDNGINMSGLTLVEKRGECAGLRQQIERICDHHELCYVRARYGLATLKTTLDGLKCFAGIAQQELANGQRRAQRGLGYVADLVQLAIRPNHNPVECTVMSVSRKHQVGHSIVSKDMSLIKRVFIPVERSILTKVECNFSDGFVLPLHNGTDYGTKRHTRGEVAERLLRFFCLNHSPAPD